MLNIPIHDIYTIRQAENGYVLMIHDDKLITTVDPDYSDALSRLITYLTHKITKLEEEK